LPNPFDLNSIHGRSIGDLAIGSGAFIRLFFRGSYAGVIRAGGHLMVIHDSGLVKMFPINETFAPAKYYIAAEVIPRGVPTEDQGHG
jgi:hypothetical protein